MFALFLLALALSMDAFAAALSQGAAGAGRGAALRIGAAFGFAQGAMPLLGWGLGLAFARVLQAVDHWIALILLSVLGLKMLREAFTGEDSAPKQFAGWAKLKPFVQYVLPLRWSLYYALSKDRWRRLRERVKAASPGWERCACPGICAGKVASGLRRYSIVAQT